MSDIITLENITYVYSPGTPYEKKALDNISVSFEKGTVTGIIGHTGSGKSTLVRLLNGLERPSSGRVLLDGEDIWLKPKSIGKIRFRVGLVMQYPEYQLFEETVRKDIAFGPKNMKLPEDEIERRVRETAKTVGLSEEVLDMAPFDLSGGRKRRAAIAGVMAMTPEVLILDEPAAGLDPEGRKKVFDAISAYKEEHGATVIIVSHSMEDMAERCDRLCILNNGRIAAYGNSGDIFGDPSVLIGAGLDVPEITAVAYKLSERGLKLGKAVFTVSDAAEAVAEILKGRKAGSDGMGKGGFTL
ncbi:MAG: energy-coupling factor transporter ATPase [Clostridia bacterium]|nr:energy-coupling factor transporter ATPase [Clostridia bacterium]